MKYYQHKFDKVTKYLHHRPPFLLVDKVVSITTQEVVTQKTVIAEEFIQGHFPGAPVFPGSMMNELTTQSAGILIASQYNPMRNFDTEDPNHNEYALGVLVKTDYARYRGFARMDDVLVATVWLNDRVSEMFDFSGTVSVNRNKIMRNRFRLMNIKSSALQKPN
tara:strand:+ start:532 stop:1023 length:492 start_codon:yes stop_codon:yes gene_type:complete